MKKYKQQKGEVLILSVIFFLIISLTVVIGVSLPLSAQVKAATRYSSSEQSYATAEALVDDAFYRLNKGLSLPANLTLSLNNATSSASVTDSGSTKTIVSQGESAHLLRSARTVFVQGTGTSFSYGLQVGTGGISMSGGAGVEGSVYANGDIVGSGGVFIRGTAIAANTTAGSADQVNVGTLPPPANIITSTASASEDFAQSFRVSKSGPINEVRLYMKQLGSLPNATILITTDSNGKPGSTLASGTLSSTQVGTSYGWVGVSLNQNPTLTTGSTYWIVLDTTAYWYTTANAFYIGAMSDSYATGTVKMGKVPTSNSWVASSPSTLDAYFQIYMGGDYGQITGISSIGTGGVGDAQAHTVKDSNIAGNNYCQTGTGNNKICNTSQADPSPISFPVSDSNIVSWKDEASAGTTRGSWSLGGSTVASTTGPTKINGDLNISAGSNLTINGTLYVTGNLNLGGGGYIKLGSSYGNTSGVIVVDGRVDFSGGAYVTGNGNAGSYAVLVTTSSCPSGTGCDGNNAIEARGGTGSVVLVAQNGTIEFEGGASAKSAVAKSMTMSGGTILRYESGLANINFNNSPSGSWNVQSWEEIAQ